MGCLGEAGPDAGQEVDGSSGHLGQVHQEFEPWPSGGSLGRIVPKLPRKINTTPRELIYSPMNYIYIYVCEIYIYIIH